MVKKIEKRVSVHDPSIIQDTATKKYYIYGSHLAQASSVDLMNWDYLGVQGYENRTVYGNGDQELKDALEPSFAWAGYNDEDCKGGYAVWAPDILYNPSYLWSDGSSGAYMMYYCTSSTYIRSCIGYAVSRSIEGPFSYVDTIIYSGFTASDNYVTTTSDLGTKTVNINYTSTNIPALIETGVLSNANSSWFNNSGGFNNSLYPNAIDPNILFDTSGRLWMSYGSWSGGLFLMELDAVTGQAKYPGTTSGNTDAYFGTRICGGYTRSGEAPYIIYDAQSGYYFLYDTYGWLGADGGYHMRLFRSTSITGPYTDAAGNPAVFTASTDPAEIGLKLFGNYEFSSLPVGYKSGGHNSAIITGGNRYVVYHTRFNAGTEYHEVRVHQQFLNEDNWPVTAVYEYLGSELSPNGYSLSDMVGTYEFINHGRDASTANVGMLPTLTVSLNSDGRLGGDVSGSWSYTQGTCYLWMFINNVTYRGVFFKQYDESEQHNEVMTCTLAGNNNESIWCSKVSDEELPYDPLTGEYYIQNVFSRLYMDIEDGKPDAGANIRQWSLNGSQAQKFRIVADGNGYYHILTGASNYKCCVDVFEGNPADGTNIFQYTYWGGEMQQYKITVQADGSYALLTRASGDASCIEVWDWSTEAGGNIDQWTYHGADIQHWKLIPAD